jgi:beta-glucosidase/6-phospho-beta-glucosidase/beta-galactosidase
MSYFPNDFLLGAATAAHQVEGNNTNSDFRAMEQVPGSMFKARIFGSEIVPAGKLPIKLTGGIQ